MDGETENFDNAAHVLMADVIPSVSTITNTITDHTPSIDVTSLVEAAAKETMQLQGNLVAQFNPAVTC